MGFFRFRTLAIPGLLLIEPKVYNDERGFFFKPIITGIFKPPGWMPPLSRITIPGQKGVLRGCIFRCSTPRETVVRAVAGEIFDVAVDLRASSPTYKRWYGVVLSSENKRQLYIPEALPMVFLSSPGVAEVLYKCTEYYYPEDEEGIIWNDPEIGIKWPLPVGETPSFPKKTGGLKAWLL